MKTSNKNPVPTGVNLNGSGKQKVPPHRKAIQEASKIQPTGKIEPLDSTQTSSQGLPLSQAEITEDYETSKVSKNKKTQHDADIMSVKDLDRWG
jgi:hypothetical protein